MVHGSQHWIFPGPASRGDAVFGSSFFLPARERIFIERMTSDRKLKASREGSK